MALTKEQLALVNNLMYLGNGDNFGTSFTSITSAGENITVGEWLSRIDENSINENASYDFMTGKEWKEVIAAVKQDSSITSLTIQNVHVDHAEGGGGGTSALLVNPSTKEATVVFCGTASDEWTDNLSGAFTSDTQQQKNALDWYQDMYKQYGLEDYDITVTGHSKGGNKSKYITVLDPTVDHCVSFDGQGFSDEFFDKYKDEITLRQGKIENCNVDTDFVSPLMSDVGNITVYNHYNIGEGGFLESHCMNTFLHFNEDGTFTMDVNPNGRDPMMDEMDQFINSLIRSVPEDKRENTLGLLSNIVNGVFGGEELSMDSIMNLLSDPKYGDSASYILGYLLKYEQENPGFATELSAFLGKNGMNDVIQFVYIADALIHMEIDVPLLGTYNFNDILGLLLGGANLLPDFIKQKLLDLLKKKTGIDLSLDQVKTIIKLLEKTNGYMQTVKIPTFRKDRTAKSVLDSLLHFRLFCNFEVNTDSLKKDAEQFLSLRNALKDIAEGIDGVIDSIEMKGAFVMPLRLVVRVAKNRVDSIADSLGMMSDGLKSSAESYMNAEKKNEDNCVVYSLNP